MVVKTLLVLQTCVYYFFHVLTHLTKVQFNIVMLCYCGGCCFLWTKFLIIVYTILMSNKLTSCELIFEVFDKLIVDPLGPVK